MHVNCTFNNKRVFNYVELLYIIDKNAITFVLSIDCLPIEVLRLLRFSQKAIMAERSGYIYDHFIPEEGAVAVCIIDDCIKLPTIAVVKRAAGDSVTTKKEKKKSVGLSMSKTTICMRERREDLEYCREKRKRKVEYKKGKEERLQKILLFPFYLTIQTKWSNNWHFYQHYVMRKKVKLVQITTFVHEKFLLLKRRTS